MSDGVSSYELDQLAMSSYELDQLIRFMQKFVGLCDDYTQGVAGNLTVQIDDATFVIEKAADEVPILVQHTVKNEESK